VLRLTGSAAAAISGEERCGRALPIAAFLGGVLFAVYHSKHIPHKIMYSA